ncbi:phosphomannomutase-like protein, putative [Trypanosoma cruzi]|uniref:Phosphomannomutase-like protein, putative n=1 Tax=Trypanosoma cruzi (strain CL Brener) TaxID=353153 RepID=Q4DX52_TRYCC|nr:phosphomannomutase-like protein, putative [Trypanosoma cruzi]EAN97088.1 phosphomannomutase-like protein, putative [Trypanosoma cruzi]|eukprot:XP_818939.1 phosphomannomutase-like protein [Trypanosoma cruzi strain CL Brener]
MSVEKLVQEWISWDRDPETRGVIEKLWKDGDTRELQILLGNRMEFGTAGLRSKMGAGNSQMNCLTIIQTAQGLSAYLRATFTQEKLSSGGVVIGYDGRYGSKRFAELSANVFTNAGINTRLFGQVVPTPFVPFAIRLFGCVAGVVVTASHNPKEYNGYKVYWSNGAQIISPHDKNISKFILENLTPLGSSWEAAAGVSDPFQEVWDQYFATLKAEYKPLAANYPVKVTYTALHGVGCPFTMKSLETVGVPRHCISVVRAQAEPDPEFPTVKFPNPEEGAGTLTLSMETAAEAGSNYILANDPDADRLAVAERKQDGTWRIFSGNELGALLGWWTVFRIRRLGEPLENCYFIFSIVSSMILRSIAKKEGMHYAETLTGFKWMGSLAESLQRESSARVVLAFEEAIGYMFGTRVFDKDGVTAAAVVADMIAFLEKEEKKRLSEKLLEIFKQYGFHFTCNSYVIARDPARVSEMFGAITKMQNGSYPKEVAGARVLHIRDLASGLDTQMPDGRATLPISASSPIITFYFDNGVTMTIRGSGTEPKLKWYAELITEDPLREKELAVFVDKAVEELVRPSYYNFEYRSNL